MSENTDHSQRKNRLPRLDDAIKHFQSENKQPEQDSGKSFQLLTEKIEIPAILANAIKPLSKAARQELARVGSRKLQARKEPSTWEEHLSWHRAVYLIHELDNREYSTTWKSQVTRMVRKSISFLKKDYFPTGKTTNPDYLEALDGKYVRELYRLLSVQVSAQGMTVCQQAFTDLEKNIAENADDVPQFLRKRIAKAKDFERKRQAELNTSIRTALSVAMPETPVGKLRALLTKDTNGDYVYRYRDSAGAVTQWKIEVYDELSAEHCCIRCLEKDDMLLSLTFRELFQAIENESLDTLIEKAQDNYAKENTKENRTRLESFDLQPESRVAHLRVFPKSYDNVMADGLHSSMLLSTALRHRYGERLQAMPMHFSDDPKESLIYEIKRAYQAGIKYFCIDVFSHGEEDRLSFEEGMTAQDLADIVRRFPDCTFVLGTIACFGGGLREGILKELEREPELSNRVHIFLQTKPNVVGYGAHVPGKNKEVKNIQTAYYLHFMQALYDGKTYGEAARIADLEVKKYMPLDAEAIINGQLITLGTKGSKNSQHAA